MGSTLASREDSVINALLEVFRILEILPEEDETSTRTTESLVAAIMLAPNKEIFKRGARCRGDDITVFEGVVQLLRSNETTGVCNICHEPGAFPCSGLLEVLVIPVTRVSRGTTNNQTGLEDLGLRG